MCEGHIFYAAATVPIYIEIPEEDKSEDDRICDNVGILNLSMYGTREAARALQVTVNTHLCDFGFIMGTNKSVCVPAPVAEHQYVCARRRLLVVRQQGISGVAAVAD